MTSTVTLDRSAVIDLVQRLRPLSEIRALLSEWAEAGATREQLKAELSEVRSHFAAAEDESQEDLVLEALDLVEGWVSSHQKLRYKKAVEAGPVAERLAVVCVPLGTEFDQIRTDLIVPALQEAGFEVAVNERSLTDADSIFTLVQNLKQASIAVLDLTGSEPNVMYVLGLAHGLRSRVIALAQELEAVPFDLRAYEVLTYSTRLDEIGSLKTKLHEALSGLDEDTPASKGPVDDLAREDVRAQPSASDETEKAEAPGIYDLLPTSIEAMESISEGSTKFAELTERLGGAVSEQTAQLEGAKSRGGPGAYAVQLRGLKVVTAFTDEFADEVDRLMPQYRANWHAFATSMEWLNLVDVESGEDQAAAAEFLAVLDTLQMTITGAVESVEGFRDAVLGLMERRLSKDLNRSLRRVSSQLRTWIDLVLTGNAQLGRMRNLLHERLHQDVPR